MTQSERSDAYNYTTDDLRYLYHPEQDMDASRKTRYFSVTSILSRAWPAPFLEQWRNTNLFNALVRNDDGILDNLRMAKEWEPSNVMASMVEMSKLRVQYNDARNDVSAANRGTRIHKTIEMTLRTGDKSYVKEHYQKNEKEGNVAAATLMWLRKNKIEPLHLEVPVWMNTPHVKYTGVVDLVVDGERFGYPDSWAVFDFKFGRNMNPTYAMQIAAYAQANEAQLYGQDPSETNPHYLFDTPPVYVAGIIHNHTGEVELYDVNLKSSWEHFTLLYKIFLLSMAYPKNVMKEVEVEDLVVSIDGIL